MYVDGGCRGLLTSVRHDAKALEELGYDCVSVPEVAHDGFLPLPLLAEATTRVSVGTSILVAFSRTPMTTALASWDVHSFSGGRLLLGLGSQIKPHIEKRFSMPWSAPAARMREYVQALHAIWDCWQNGTKLDFRGDFYTHTLMTPMFEPGKLDTGPPKVVLAAVGQKMTEVAAEVADGMLMHSFTTERYAREVTVPTIERALEQHGRKRSDFEIRFSPFVVAESDPARREAAVRAVRKQIAFYASTPAYRPVLELHGWGPLQTELQRMSKIGQWDEMGELIDDEILSAFAIVAEPERLAAEVIARSSGMADRVGLSVPVDADPAWHADVISQIKAAG